MRKHKNTFWKKVAITGLFGLLLVGGMATNTEVFDAPSAVLAQVPTAPPANPPATNPTPTPSTTPAANPNGDAEKQMNQLINILVQLVKSLLVLLLPLNIMIGKLLSNDWVYLDGAAYKAIETIWILVRNIVNVVFAAILLIIAVSQIASAVTGSESKNLAIKQVLPKFIFGLLFVNFSLLTCRVILDVGNLASTAAFSIANETGKNLFASEDANEETVMKKFYCWPTEPGQKAVQECAKGKSDHKEIEKCQDVWLNGADTLRNCMGEKLFVAFGNGAVKNLYARKDIAKPVGAGEGGDMALAWSNKPPSNIASAIFGSRNVMFIYTNNIFRIPELLLVYDSQKSPGNALGKAEGILIQTFLTLLYGAGVLMVNVAFFLALAVRLVLIWILLIFSPLMALEIVFPDKIKGMLGKAKFTKGMLKSLLDLALMPAMVGIVLSVGFIIFSVLTKIIAKTTAGALGGGSCGTADIPCETYKLPPFSIEVSGSPLGNVFSTMGEFIVAIIILVVLWEAVFYMMQTGTMVDGVVKKIKGIGDSLAGSAKMIPFIPMPRSKDDAGKGPKFVSAGSLGYATRALENTLARHEQTSAEKGLGGTWVGDLLNIQERTKEREAHLKEQELRLQEGKHLGKEDYKGFLKYSLSTATDKPDTREKDASAAGIEKIFKNSKVDLSKFLKDGNDGAQLLLKRYRENPEDITNNREIRRVLHEIAKKTDTPLELREALKEMHIYQERFIDDPKVAFEGAGSGATKVKADTVGPQIVGDVKAGTPINDKLTWDINLTIKDTQGKDLKTKASAGIDQVEKLRDSLKNSTTPEGQKAIVDNLKAILDKTINIELSDNEEERKKEVDKLVALAKELVRKVPMAKP